MRESAPWGTPFWLVTLAGVLLALVFVVDDAARPVVIPIVLAIGIAAWTWVSLSMNGRGLAVLDIGALFTFIVLLYTIVPLLGYLAGGLAFSLLSDSRLLPYNPSPEEMGEFAGRYLAFFAAFCLTYVFLRFRNVHRQPVPRVANLSAATVTSVSFWLALGVVYLVILWIATGFSFYSSYEDLQSIANLYSSLPLVVQQVSHNVSGIVTVLKIALLIVLYSSWAKWHCRLLIAIWVALELAVSLVALGPRTPMLMFLVANVLLYHRFVRKLGFKTASALALLLGAGALGYGFLRDYLGVANAVDDAPLLATSNEFQSLFATGYDVTNRYAQGDLSVPWQIYIADFLRLFPRQILPFEKIDPHVWYVQLIGAEGTGVGYLFGTIAEGTIGGGWIGLIARGILLGALMSSVHAWYEREQRNFYVTLIYVWLCLHVYYCIRASSLYILVWILYRLVPSLLLIWTTKRILDLASAHAVGALDRPPSAQSVQR